MLNEVWFQNIRSLRDVRVDLERFTVLVGPNGCGKSTFLNQIEFLCQMSAPETTISPDALGTIGAQLRRIGPYALRTSGVNAPMRWSGTAADRQLDVVVPLHERGSWWDVATAIARVDGVTFELRASTAEPQRQDFEVGLDSRFGWRAQRLRLAPDAISRPSPVSVTALDPSGFGLPTILKDLAGDDTHLFDAVQADLRRVVPQFERLRFGKDNADGVDMTTLLLEMRGGGRLPASEVSDGTVLALAVLTAAHNPALPPLMLIDDIDHGLHLSAQFAIVKAIRAAMESRQDLQVICTTHAPVLLDSFDASEVRVMALDAEGHTVARKLTDNPDYERYRTLLQTGELWASTGEDWVVDAVTGT
jgi:predicted ATPase